MVQKLLNFKSWLLLLTMLLGTISTWAAEEVYKTAKFGSKYNSMSYSSYDNSWYSTNDGFRVNLTNFNNNNNGWEYVKCGRKNNTSTATITTNAAIDKPITKVDITIDALTATKINSITLYTSTNGTTWTSAGTYTKATGAQSVSLASPTANLYYKIEFNCASGSSNGLLTLSKVEFYYNAVTTHTLTYSATNGSIGGIDAESNAVASGGSVAEGATVTLTATPSDGYEFSSWSVSGTGSELSSTTDNPTTFTMGTANATVTANFVASSTVATPSFSVAEGTYNNAQSVELNCGTDGATIYYTTDGTDPTTSSSVYSSAISVTQTTTIKAFAVKDDLTDSGIASATYTLVCSNPSFSISEGTFNTVQSVALSCDTEDATIRYTTDGTTPTSSSSVYSSAISVDRTMTIKAKAFKSGYSDSEEASATYTLKCVAPTFDPAAGSVGYGTEITLATTTPSASIYYTTNGDAPTSSSSTYDSSNKPTVSGNQTFKAIATKSGWSDSDVSSATYTYYYVITAGSNNGSYGTVSGSTTITATPEEGYRVVAGDGGYTVTSGTATVVNNGDNTFTVTPTSNCTVQINFETIPTHTVTFCINGDVSRTATVREGSTITFPTAKDTPADATEFNKTFNGKTFVGWYTSAYSHASTAPTYVNTATATMSTSDVTYYAVYADVEEEESDDISKAIVGQSLEYDTWTYSGSTKDMTSYRLFGESAYIESASFDFSKLKKVEVYAGTYGTLASGKKKITIMAGDTEYGTASLSTNNAGTKNTVTNGSSLSGTGKVKVIAAGGDASNNGIRISKVDIYVKGTITTPSNFTTDARTDAGIAYANAEVDVKLTSGYTGQALTNPNSMTVTYSSSDEDVATVDEDGEVTIVAVGSATITATFAGNATYKPAEVSYTLNVTEKTPAGLAYATAEVEKLTTDDAFTNTLTNGYSLTVSYSSSDTGVATVNASTGEVTIKSAGETTITASFAGDEDYEAGNASYTLTVSKATPTLNFASDNAIGREGEEFAGNALTNPANLTVTYSSSDTDVATVNSSTGAVTIVADGTTTITASFAGNDTYISGSASYTLKVLDTPTITVSDDEVTYGETYTYSAGGSDTGGAITITSGNTSIATVDGLEITPVAVGEVEITVSRAENDTYKAGEETFTLTVTAPAGKTTAKVKLFEETFASSTGGPLSTWGGSEANGTLTTDNKGWTNASGSGAGGCAKYGTGSVSGSATTPSITVENGKTYTLSFKSAPWSTEASKTITVTVSGGTIDSKSSVTTSSMTTKKWNSFNYDIVASSTSMTITFVCSANRFFLDDVKLEENIASTTVTLNKYGFATYCSVNPIDFSSTTGYTAWRVNNIDTDGTITFTKITEKIKGGQGVVLYNKNEDGVNTSSATITFADGTTEFDENENMLVGTTAPTYIAEGTVYGLSANKFVINNAAGNIGANKAYILASSIPNEVKAFTFVFEDEATGITETRTATREEVEAIFNLRGQHLNRMQKGINIVNGKKILVK